jgi:thymidylate synthase (FAD)
MLEQPAEGGLESPDIRPGDLPGELRVFDHGFVRLDAAMADDLSVVNGARVSFAVRKEVMEERDKGLIRFLMRERHGCFDDATDVLTDAGWRPWPQVTGEERFATLSRAGTIEYQPALGVIHKDYKGLMVGFKGTCIDKMVTPDHRVLASRMTTRPRGRSPAFSLTPARDVLWVSHRHLTTASWRGRRVDRFAVGDVTVSAKPWLRLVGFFIGDGHAPAANNIQFHLQKHRELAFLHQVTRDLGLRMRSTRESHYVPLPSVMRDFFELCYGAAREKVIPRPLLELDATLLGALLEGLIQSNGTRGIHPGRRDRVGYNTTSKALADQIQELALKVGRCASVRPHPSTPGDGHHGTKNGWHVTIFNPRNSQPGLCRTRAEADNHMDVVDYEGGIHCVAVPNGTLYVRRNGYPVFSGNSPFEHNAFRFHIRTPIFVAREWFRHRIGCLAGDTVVSFVNVDGDASRQLAKTVDELWRMWTDARRRVRKMRLRVLNEQSGEFQVGHIQEILDTGVQPVYELELDDGTRLKATEKHRLLTDQGWRTLREAVRLVGSGHAARATRPCHVITNGDPVDTSCKCLRRGGKLHAHDSDEPRVTRLMSRSEDITSLPDVPRGPGVRLRGHPVRIITVRYVGLRQTYDLSVSAPWHNFVANGVVVHNSFNEESARYHMLEGDFYVPTSRAVRKQVGKPGSYSFEPTEEQVAADTIATFERIYGELYREYQGLIDQGVAKELARALLPFGVYTQFYWTLNARSLMNFLSLRNSPNAQFEIRTYAQAVERLFAQRMPVTHECFLEFGRNVP